MTKNHMKDVADWLGVQLNEEFFVKVPDGWPVRAKLSRYGAQEEIHGTLSHSDKLLTELITGKAKIVRN